MGRLRRGAWGRKDRVKNRRRGAGSRVHHDVEVALGGVIQIVLDSQVRGAVGERPRSERSEGAKATS